MIWLTSPLSVTVRTTGLQGRGIVLAQQNSSMPCQSYRFGCDLKEDKDIWEDSMRTRGLLKIALRAAVAPACLAGALIAPTVSQALDVPVAGTNGMISAGHPLAVQSGLKVLRDGGTACDAAVATAATLSVMMTDMMGPLGSGYAVIYDARGKKVSAVDYNGVAPAATDPKKFTMEDKRRGILSATVPGNLRGWEEIHKRCGVLPWANLWADAIAYAENGRAIDNDTAFHIRRHVSELAIYDTWNKEFLIDGKEPPPAGHILKRPDLAESYKLIAKMGSAAVYDGPIGDKIASYMEKNNGLITKQDLKNYSVKWLDPITSTYRGHAIYGAPPSSSAITWMEILKIVEGYDLAGLKRNSPEYLRVFIEATKYAYEDGYRYNGDPGMVSVPVEKLLSDQYAAEIRKSIDAVRVRDFKPMKTGLVHPPYENHATSHMAVIDKDGNAVSSTNTHGTFWGGGFVVEGTGLIMSNGMDWFDINENIWTGEKPGLLAMAPGKRNRWTLSPGMIFKDNRLFMLIGGAGAEATMWGIAQPIVNVIDFGMNAQAALSEPRFRYGDLYHYTGGNQIALERGIAPEVEATLKSWGYTIDDPTKPRSASRGTTNMIVIDPKSGAYWGGAAPAGRDFVSGY
jgi:gamma-glutamyltranspeptidase